MGEISMRWTLVPLASVLVACSTTPVSTAEADPVPASRILDSSLLRARPGTTAVTVKRDAGMSAGACAARVWLNGQAIAELRTSEKVTLHLTPGAYMLAAQNNSPCAGRLAELHIMVGPNSPSAYRMGFGSAGEFALEPTAF